MKPNGHQYPDRVVATDQIERGRAALAAGDWETARVHFHAALAHGASAEAHEGLGTALWWLCEPRQSVRHREHAFVLLRQAGDAARACLVAVDLVVTYLFNLGNEPAAHGWLARGESVEREVGADTAAHGWLLLARGYVERDPVVAMQLLEESLAWGKRAGDVDLELVALADLGLAHVAAGHVTEGMVMLDESMAATMGGEPRRFETVAYNCCSMLAACHLAGDVERAGHWCGAAEEFMHSISCPFLSARCRVHYGSLLFERGVWDRAETELEAAVRMSEDIGPGPREEALARLAQLRIRQGRLEDADAVLLDCDEAGSGRLAAAALRLARGETAAAAELLRHDGGCGEAGGGNADALALLVEVELARGEIDAATTTAAALERLAAVVGASVATVAASARANGLVHLARGEREAAVAALSVAVRAFAAASLPYEEGSARLEMARSLAPDRPAVAVAEARNALRGFEHVGATVKTAQAAAFLRSLGARTSLARPLDHSVLTPREREVLELVGHGLTNPEIAERLFISRKTASNHVSAILAKLGLRNRVELAAHGRAAPRTVP